jgi:CDP-glycerol glycerophosphotransferase (TagB/SpsB family)/glycosyltransferase involved in cell wall biosynthesis
MSKLRRIASDALSPKLKNRLRNAVHPAQRLAMTRLVGGRRSPDLGLLSVVIPVLNVEAYVSECLASVAGQSYTNLEIIVVDDGSTDESMRLVGEFAKWDKRIKVIRLEHGGNGRARNIGVAAATGAYLTFADSDDIVAPGAYELMMSTITKTDSDFVVGSSDRLVGKKRQPTKLSSRMHAESRLGIAIDDFPDILDDVFLWNKLFQKSFWDKSVSPIPEGVLYEDQETTARAFVNARAFDVIDKVIQRGTRGRGHHSAAPIHPTSANLNDFFASARRIASGTISHASGSVVEKWYLKVVSHDLTPYVEHVPRASAEYWRQLHEGIVSLDSHLKLCLGDLSHLNSQIDPHARVLFALALAGMKDQIEQVVVDRLDSGNGFQINIEDGKFIAVPNYSANILPHIPGLVLDCAPSLMQMTSAVALEGRTPSGGLRLTGHGFLHGLKDDLVALSVSMVDGSVLQATVKLELSRTSIETIDLKSNDAYASHMESGFKVEIPVAGLPDGPLTELRVMVTLTANGHHFTSEHMVSESTTHRAKFGTATSPEVVGFEVDPDNNEFSIVVDQISGHANLDLFLATKRSRIDPTRISRKKDGTNRFTFSLKQSFWGQEVSAPLSGAYTLRYAAADMAGVRDEGRPLNVADHLQTELPNEHRLDHANVTEWSTPNKTFAVTIGPPLSLHERGKFWQRRLQRSFTDSPAPTLAGHTVFESFGGIACTDSPRAISDALHMADPHRRIYWSISDYSVPYPEYALPLVKGSSKWFDKVQTAKVLVNNNNFPFYFRKRPEQFYIQTWHGTPLKKIGIDSPVQYVSPAYRELLKREAQSWDLLLSQNEYSTTIFPGAFGYQGEVLTRGYPRNDDLVAEGAAFRRARVRENLGLSESQKVVLYAPTWRDDAKSPLGSQQWVGYLESKLATEVLGDDFVFLIRAHHNVDSRNDITGGDNVINVSTYPEINDLILASDGLVTDYSSIMFDYMATGKPIYFLAPDAERYAIDTRGFYLDYHELTANSLYDSTSELVIALGSMLVGEKEASLTDIYEGFIPYADGFSSDSVVERMISILRLR